MRYLILTLVAGSSTSSLALKPSAFYVIYDGIISPGLMAAHMQALKAFRVETGTAAYQDPHHPHDFDHGLYMTYKPQAAAQNRGWQATESQTPQSFIQKNARTAQLNVLDQEITNLSYLPKISLDAAINEYSQHITWLQLHVMGGQSGALESALAKWVAQLKAANSPLRFSVYSKTFYGQLSQFVVVFHQAIHTTPEQLLPQSVLAKVSTYDVSQGIHQPVACCD